MNDTTRTSHAAPPERDPPGSGDPTPAAESIEHAARAVASDQSPADIFKQLGPAGWLAVAAAILPLLGSILLFAFMAQIAPWLHEQRALGLTLFVSAFAVLAGLALLPTYAQCALGGFAFGIAWGLPASILGFVLAATIAYEIASRASGDRAVRLIHDRPKLRAVYRAFIGESAEERGFFKTLWIVTLIRLPPNSPFALTNLVLASTRVPRPAYILGTAIGMAPRSAAAVVLGAGISEFTKENLRAPTPIIIGGIVLAVVVIAIIGHMANKAVTRAIGPAGAPAPTPAAETPPRRTPGK